MRGSHPLLGGVAVATSCTLAVGNFFISYLLEGVSSPGMLQVPALHSRSSAWANSTRGFGWVQQCSHRPSLLLPPRGRGFCPGTVAAGSVG